MNHQPRSIDESNLSIAERDARRQVRKLRGFYVHMMIFAAVNAGLVIINLATSPARLWFYWPLLGWGLGLAIHALATFARNHWLGAEWEDRKLQSLLASKSVK